MALELPALVQRLILDPSGFATGALAAQGTMGKFSSKAIGLGASLTKFVTLPIVGIGVAAVAAALTVDDAYDKIRTGTGATGTRLESLKESFRNVAKNVPADLGAVADTLVLVNQRLGLTGKPLEKVTTQLLELSRITGTDVNANVEAATKFFGDWGVATENQAATLDKLFRASQQSGVGVDRLMTLAFQFGAPMRAMGFSMEETIAMLAKFEKEGVRTELVMGAMRIAIGKLADEGVPANKMGEALRGRIEAIKNAANPAAAAIELFGQRAGPDMAAAIVEGRLSVDEMVNAINNGKDTIEGVADETKDFPEQFKEFKNQAIIALAPLGEKLFPAIARAMDVVIPIVSKLADAFNNLGPTGQTVVVALAALLAMAGPLATIIGLIATPIGVVVIGLAALAAGIILLWQHWDTIWTKIKEHPALLALAPVVAAVLGPILVPIAALVIAARYVYDNWSTIWPAVSGFVQSAVDVIMSIVGFFVESFRTFWRLFGDEIVEYARISWEFVSGIVRGALDIITGVFNTFKGLFTLDWDTFWSGIKDLLSGIWTTIGTLVSTAIDSIKLYITTQLGLLGTVWTEAWGAIRDFLSLAWEAIKTAVSNGINGVVSFVSSLPGRVLTALAGVPGLLISTGSAMLGGLLSGAIGKWGELSGWLGGLAGRVVNAIGDAANMLLETGKRIMNGLWEGLKDGWNRVVDWASKLVVPKGPSERYDAMMLVPSGRLIMSGLQAGLESGWSDVEKWASGLTVPAPELSFTVDTGAAAALGRAAAPIAPAAPVSATEPAERLVDRSTNVHLEAHGPDARAVAEELVDELPWALRTAPTGGAS